MYYDRKYDSIESISKNIYRVSVAVMVLGGVGVLFSFLFDKPAACIYVSILLIISGIVKYVVAKLIDLFIELSKTNDEMLWELKRLNGAEEEVD